ncbi:MAG: hypothetical protein EA355_05825 [Rhodobacteraceae bacterium]|nr:MAG: hypothetical protein EA355_05825 [Paracoccaceae bacterium]
MTGRPSRGTVMRGAASPAPASGATPSRALPTNPRVVVSGAGAAGIAAARALIAAGLEVAVIEAADRIGGRASTDADALGQPIGGGAIWLQGPADMPLLALAREAGLGLHDHAGARAVCLVGDRRADAGERRLRDRAWAAVHGALEAAEGDVAAASVLSWEASFVESVAIRIQPMDFGVDMDAPSTADWASCADSETNHLAREGSGARLARMGEGLSLRLRTAARAVDWSPNAFVSHAVDDPMPAEACCFLALPTGHDYVAGFAGGAFGRALEREGEAAAVAFAPDRFAATLGEDVRKRFRRGLMSGWDANPLTRGAYRAARPGGFAACAAKAEPLGDRVFFAGEAMATPFAALVSGAQMQGAQGAETVARTLDAPGCRGCAARGAAKARARETDR